MKTERSFQDIYDVVRLIPRGRVTNYGAIAEYLGSKRGARLVGWAMNQAHGLHDVPAHRVVNRNGVLSGKNHFSSPTAMQDALEAEGIRIENDQILDFENVFWNPVTEL